MAQLEELAASAPQAYAHAPLHTHVHTHLCTQPAYKTALEEVPVQPPRAPTAIALQWSTPDDNGLALTAYRPACYDNSTYLVEYWRQEVTDIMLNNPTSPPSITWTTSDTSTYTLNGLTAGTSYVCTVTIVQQAQEYT